MERDERSNVGVSWRNGMSERKKSICVTERGVWMEEVS